jgi:hypothetical protein
VVVVCETLVPDAVVPLSVTLTPLSAAPPLVTCPVIRNATETFIPDPDDAIKFASTNCVPVQYIS